MPNARTIVTTDSPQQDMLGPARWAARAYAEFDRPRVHQIVRPWPTRPTPGANASPPTAVRETGFGVVKDKELKNRTAHEASSSTTRRSISCARGSTPRATSSRSPAGGSHARAHSVDQSGLHGVLQGHPGADDPQRRHHLAAPAAKKCCTAAARVLAQAAGEAPAHPTASQVIDQPSIPLVEALMADDAPT